jgi:hypothetical protein
MWKAAVLLLGIASHATGEVVKTIPTKNGQSKKCVGNPDKVIQLGTDNSKLSVCKGKCLGDAKCVAMQYNGSRSCKLYYSDVKVSGLKYLGLTQK